MMKLLPPSRRHHGTVSFCLPPTPWRAAPHTDGPPCPVCRLDLSAPEGAAAAAGSQFSHLQTVPVWAVRAARLLALPSGELLLACLTADGRLVYLLYRGPAGFERRGQLAVGHAASVEMFNMAGLATQVAVAGRHVRIHRALSGGGVRRKVHGP